MKLKVSTLLLAIALISNAYTKNNKNLPNVIYILTDDLGYGDLSCYGQTKFQTPNIDRLANEGLKFTQHYSGNTVCSPSRSVLMSGMHPGKAYCRGNTIGEVTAHLPLKITSLAEVFKNAGYATGAYGKWGLGFTTSKGAANPINHGFDEFYGWKSQFIAHTYYPNAVVHNGKEIPLDSGTFVHDMIMDKAMEFIEIQANADEPFFCYIPTAVPHAAMHAPKELHDKWRKEFPEFDDVIGKYTAGKYDYCPDVQNPIAGFAAMMENLDNQVGVILDMLKKLGIEDNTLVLFASDNGAHKEGGHDPVFWNSTGGLRGMKRDMHEGGIRTPMMAYWPGTIKAGTETDHISAFWDVMATVADLTKQNVPEQCDGISFLPTLLGKTKKQDQHEYLYWEFRKGKENEIIFSQAVRAGKWKAYLQDKHEMEIFNLEEDPFETNNIASEHPEIVKKMEGYIKDAATPLPKLKE